MPRNPRCVLPGVAHQVTQRGVNREDVFYYHRDRETYLTLMQDQRKDAGVHILGWCLMTNHVHWVVVPEQEDSLAVLFRRVNGRYAQYLNAGRRRTGHLWQNRYFSLSDGCGKGRKRTAVCGVESAASRNGRAAGRVQMVERGGAEEWKRRLTMVEDAREVQRMRRAMYAGSPLGPEDFVAEMEAKFGRHWRKSGRPRKDARREEKGTERSASFLAG